MSHGQNSFLEGSVGKSVRSLQRATRLYKKSFDHGSLGELPQIGILALGSLYMKDPIVLYLDDRLT